MGTPIDRFREKQKKHDYLAFLMHLFNSLSSKKWDLADLEAEAKQSSIPSSFVFAVLKEKFIVSYSQGGKYVWNTIRPNIRMVEALISAQETLKDEDKPLPLVALDEIKIEEETKKPGEALRPYQTEGINKIFKKWREGKKAVLFQMPTGTGKTVLFNEIVRRGFQHQRKILIVVHRIELIEQITQKLQKKGVTFGHIVAGKKSDYSKNIQVASIQTLTNRDYPEANLIIIDECHHSKASSYKRLWEMYPEAKFLGVTATPWRLSGEGFDELYDELIISMSVDEFIQQKYLVPVSHYSCSTPDLSKVKKSKGDYVTGMLSEVMLDNTVMKDIVESYNEKCKDKSAIVFAVDVEHSKEIAQRFRVAGVKAAHIDAKTPKEERDRILKDFKNRNIKVVSNVEIITEGFDFPECEAVILARPTKSLSLYLQMVGRVMRPADGKTEGIILDNAGLWLEHGLSTIDREWSLFATKKKRRNEIREPQEVAIDEDNALNEINRFRPMEVKGLKLIPLSFELKKLLVFERWVLHATFNGHKLHSAYHKYIEPYKEFGTELSKEEFEYIKKRLAHLSEKVEPDRAVKPGFWYHEAQRLRESGVLKS